jgi:methylated-DNA-[protein]-cysteine S-methyltransferase
MESGHALFDTAIGRCGIAWIQASIVGLQLPEASDAIAESQLKRRFPDLCPAIPPPEIAAAIAAIREFLAGTTDTALADLPLALDSVGEWERSVYRAAQTIKVGRTITYGELAAQLGDPCKARAVGQALGRNPWPIVVPCHRITAAGGAMGGFSAPGGIATKYKLLEIEGALAPEALPLFAPTPLSG